MTSTITPIKINSSAQKDITSTSTLSSLDQRVATVASNSSSSSFSSSSVSSSPTTTLSTDFGTRAVAQVKANQSSATEDVEGYVENLKVAEGTYSGEINEQGQPHGKGILQYSKDNPRGRKIYRGDFQNGKFHGKGILEWHDGAVHEGQFVEGIRKGTGKLNITVKDNETGEMVEYLYECEFDRDKPNGEGEVWLDFPKLRGEDKNYNAILQAGEFKDWVLMNGAILYHVREFFDGEDEPIYKEIGYNNVVNGEIVPPRTCVML